MELSSLGLGTYLGPSTETADAAYTEAAGAFFAAGGTVFDTAANYRGGRSERALGAAFRGIPRGDFFVSTKAGYIPMPETTDPDEGPRAWFHRVFEAPGILSPDDLVDGCHAMTPRYLAHQLEISRQALGLETVDLFHLHNPEQQLAHLGPDAFYAAVEKAFEACEGFVQSGKIRAYGVATWNGFRLPPGQDGHLSLARLLAAASSAGGLDHHFRWIQLPLNLAMPEAYLAPTQMLDGKAMTALGAARAAGLSVQTSASIMQARILRQLPDGFAEALGLQTPAQAALQFTRSCPGVTTALCGMGRAAHVTENVAVMALPKLDPIALESLFG
ncbi:MAG: aldo/keto reductase [Geothrix sp.]|uniref:aldo/keto reductase n=1 Tax=Geothrix sp. TaxID=1962974 RepID=UPI0017926DEB|nr:aldo/keto reductase [Geothrix sp.]NWJ41562.1 aldo/keto reductase [Geothrix sp.]WIL20454.1 MAG: aldo/keto reductase [Geothrix sp.]